MKLLAFAIKMKTFLLEINYSLTSEERDVIFLAK